MKTNIFNAIRVSVLAIVLSVGLSYVYAWTAPATTPPTGNVSAPINTSGTAQIKTGDFTAWNIGATSITVSGNATVNDVYITSIGKYASELYPVNLVNAQHTVTQCSSLGGAVVTDGTGNKFCRLSATSCPVGWTKYSNWSSTQNKSGTYSSAPSPFFGCSSLTCSSGSHVWSNIATESLTCSGTCSSVTVTATVAEIGCY